MRRPTYALAIAWLLVSAACSKDKSKPKPAEQPEVARPQPPEATGDVAVVNVEGALLAVSMNGQIRPYVKSGAGWCATDNKARVLWYTSEPNDLRYIDLDDGTSHVALSDIGEANDIIIDYGEGGQIGGEDEVRPDVALRLTMAAEPSVGAKVLCDGDAWVYCYGDEADENAPLLPELESKRKHFETLKPADAAALAALAARGKDRDLWTHPPKGENPPNVKIDPSECYEDAESCGSVLVLPADPPMWVITTGNSRGDYYHEDYQLYDPDKQEFFLASDPSKRAPKPLKDEYGIGVEDLLVSPSGKAYIKGDTIATWEKVVWHAADATPCGWIGPLYSVPGPRG
jgi:hypothetical protein